MSVSVSMPQLGESVTEGTVTRWLKKEGERVEVDEPLLEVSTDKVDTEIPSPASGILRGIAVDEDETVEVGAQLAVIEDSESGDAAPAADDSAAAETAEPSQPEASRPEATQPAASQPEATQPEASQPAAAQPEQAPAASSDGWGSQPNYAPPAPPPGVAGVLRPVRAFEPVTLPRPRTVSPSRLPLTASRPHRLPPTASQRRRLPTAGQPRRPSRPRRLPRLRPTPRPRRRNTRRLRRCRAATRPTSPRWSASSPPSRP